jgi:hypothetical protein
MSCHLPGSGFGMIVDARRVGTINVSLGSSIVVFPGRSPSTAPHPMSNPIV